MTGASKSALMSHPVLPAISQQVWDSARRSSFTTGSPSSTTPGLTTEHTPQPSLFPPSMSARSSSPMATMVGRLLERSSAYFIQTQSMWRQSLTNLQYRRGEFQGADYKRVSGKNNLIPAPVNSVPAA